MRNKNMTTQTRSLLLTVVAAVAALLLGGCGLQADPARPVEEEQIKNVVEEYFVRDGSIPDYEVTIDIVDGDWARVHIAPTAVNSVTGNSVVAYLQNQDQSVEDAPPATLAVFPGNQARVATTSGWIIVAGPQAYFTDEELDAAGVPESIRP